MTLQIRQMILAPGRRMSWLSLDPAARYVLLLLEALLKIPILSFLVAHRGLLHRPAKGALMCGHSHVIKIRALRLVELRIEVRRDSAGRGAGLGVVVALVRRSIAGEGTGSRTTAGGFGLVVARQARVFGDLADFRVLKVVEQTNRAEGC